LSDDWEIEPSILFNTTFHSPVQIGVNTLATYKQMFYGGVSYRYNDAVVVMLGAKIKNKVRVYYSYDIISSKFRTYNSKGSHEIIITFDIPRKNVDKGSSML